MLPTAIARLRLQHIRTRASIKTDARDTSSNARASINDTQQTTPDGLNNKPFFVCGWTQQ